ncbi:MAG: AAA family ATPase [Rhabdochlamydiaceae bacterium]|jgi:DNA polymerase-3 subunit delta'
MPFCNLIGNEPVKAALQHMALRNSVPNTLLFYGPDGVGKSRFALAFAEVLMGKEHAHKLATQNHPDLHTYLPEGKSATHPVENIRKLIDEVALPPYEAPVKVFIIHDAHQMLPYSSNALLKTFEEPSVHSYFILLTSTLDAMLPTIVSRCRKIPFFPIPQGEIETFVKEKWKKTPEEARRIAFLSHGSLSKAHDLAQQLQLPWRKLLLEILTLRMPDDYPQFLKLATELESGTTASREEGEEESSLHAQADSIFEEIIAWYRDLHLLKEGIAAEYLYHLDRIDQLKLALLHPFPPLEIMIEKVAKARLAIQRHFRLRTVLEHLLMP